MNDNPRIANVKLDDIRFHPHNTRRDLGDLRPLVDSIRRFGCMQPIVVEWYGEYLRIRAGHRRVAAARLAGKDRIPAVIHADPLDDEDWLIHAVQENVMRRGLDEDERRDAILALRRLQCSWYGIAETFGVTESTVQRWAVGQTATAPAPEATGQSVQARRRPKRPSAVVSKKALREFINDCRRNSPPLHVVLNTLEQLVDPTPAETLDSGAA